jgi:V/A-type H+-transporting ATPase subunit E
MALKDILNSISEKLQEELGKIDEDEKKAILDIQKQMAEEEKKAMDELNAQRKKKESGMKQKMDTILKMESRNALLKSKTDLIDQVFEGALDQLKKLPDKEYESWLKKALKNVAVSEGEIVPAKGKEKITESAVKAENMNLKVGDAGKFEGGFVIRSKNVEVDNTFEAILMRQLKADLEITVAKTLFK